MSLIRARRAAARRRRRRRVRARSTGSRRRELREARPIGAEQSNTSIVFDDELILKVFRRLEAGINPELELLRFLTEHGFENIAQLEGWYAYPAARWTRRSGSCSEFVATALDGWERALDTMSDEHEAFIASAAPARRGDGAHAHDARLRAERPELLRPRRRRPSRSACSRRPSTRRSSRSSSTCPTTCPSSTRSAAAARRCATGCGMLTQPRRRRPRHPPPRRLPPRPDALDGRRLGDARLRGRAGALAAGAPPQAQPAARRGRDAALLRLRRVGGAAPARRRAAGRAGSSAPARSSSRATARRSSRRSSRPGAAMDRLLQRVRAREGRVRAPLRAEQPARLGARSRSPGSRGCWRRRCRCDAAAGRASAFGELDIWLARAGRHEELYAKLGAHPVDGGVRFAVWAPNARYVSVVGDFNDWDPAADPLQPGRRRPASGRASSTARRSGSATSSTSTGTRRPTRSRSRRRCRRRPPRSSSSRDYEWHGRGLDRRRGARRSRSSGRCRSTRCTRRRGGRASAGASSRDAARAVRARPRLHARRAAAGDAPPVLGLVGLPGDRLLRAALDARVARRLPLLRRPPARERDRRAPRLGAGALPARRVGARAVRRHRALRARTTRGAARIPTGERSSSTSAAPRCRTSCSRTRSSGCASTTPTACASTPSRRCSTSTTRGRRASGCRTSSAAARTSTPLRS